jgi:hypothetical protein
MCANEQASEETRRMAQVVIIRRGPNGGPKVERTVTDPEKIEQLLKLAEAVRQSDKTLRVRTPSALASA